MWNRRKAARFQNRKTARHVYLAAVGIADSDQASARGDLPNHASNQHQRETTPKADNDGIVHPDQIRAIADGSGIGGLFELLDPSRIARDRKFHLSAGLDKTQESQYRQKQRGSEEPNAVARKPRPEPQGKE